MPRKGYRKPEPKVDHLDIRITAAMSARLKAASEAENVSKTVFALRLIEHRLGEIETAQMEAAE